jgi:NAD(P)-dependent dehydrogenase (short-subunit alcohol dehydrogenase family)
MSERVAIVTGAGGELGRAAARRVLDLELRPLGIRVNAVAPQLLDTAANRQFAPPDALAHAVTPEAIADLLVYLASDAATPVSGAVVPAYGA